MDGWMDFPLTGHRVMFVSGYVSERHTGCVPKRDLKSSSDAFLNIPRVKQQKRKKKRRKKRKAKRPFVFMLQKSGTHALWRFGSMNYPTPPRRPVLLTLVTFFIFINNIYNNVFIMISVIPITQKSEHLNQSENMTQTQFIAVLMTLFRVLCFMFLLTSLRSLTE